MVKTIGPLLSADAHGSLSQLLTYSHRKSGTQVRTHNRPRKDPTANQQAHRRLNEFATIQWLCMSSATKDSWKAQALSSGLGIPGYQYFLRAALRNPYTNMGLIAYWPLSQTVSNQVIDFSGNSLAGDLKPTPPTNAPVIVGSSLEKFGTALQFDGSDDYLDFGNPTLLSPTSVLTFSAWFLPTQLGSSEYILEHGWNTLASRGIYFYRTTAGYFKFAVGNDSTANETTAGPYPKNTLFHLVGTFDGSYITLFINGIQKHQVPLAGPIVYDGDDFYIGRAHWSALYRIQGILAQACLYNRALSAAEILKRYRYGLHDRERVPTV